MIDVILKEIYALGLAYAVALLVVTIHELGHFLTARILGRPISSMEIGTGALVYNTSWRGIQLRFRLIPLGGYVRLAFLSNHKWKNIVVFAAGPGANLATAILLHATLGYSVVVGISYLLAGFNMLPLKHSETQLDGYQILQELRKTRVVA